jgi:hypothetical protein
VYQPVYPRSEKVRWDFVAKRMAEALVLSVFIWFCSAQYAAPTLRNSIEKMHTLNAVGILERIFKLSTISLVIWLAGFFALFQSTLNALAEVMRFGDRVFYEDWWNSASLGDYWRLWNKPVYQFMKRHVYSPLIARGYKMGHASVAVFFVSAILHEFLVGVPTHNIIGTPASLILPTTDNQNCILTRLNRCRLFGYAVPITINSPHSTSSEVGKPILSVAWQLHLLDYIHSVRPAFRCIDLFLCLAIQIWVCQ